MIQHPAGHLTDNYRKDKDSNNYKLLSLGYFEHKEILDALNKVEASRDIDEAEGFTLDKVGKNVLELRNNRNDETFRRAIKIKIRSNLSAGTIGDLNIISEILFGESFISIEETWDKEQYYNEPATMFLSIKSNPDAQSMFYEYMRSLIMSVKAGGVKLYNKECTEIPEASLNVGSLITADASYMAISTKTLQNMNITGEACAIGLVVNDYGYMEIPTRTLENMNFSKNVYAANIIMNNFSYMEIPTADLRGDKIE